MNISPVLAEDVPSPRKGIVPTAHTEAHITARASRWGSLLVPPFKVRATAATPLQRCSPAAIEKTPDPTATRWFLALAMSDSLIKAQDKTPPAPRGKLAEPLADPFFSGELKRAGHRSLFAPDELARDQLHAYLYRLAPFALAPKRTFDKPAPSPLLVPYLLGGMTYSQIEKLCWEALEHFQVETSDSNPENLAECLTLTGFGAACPHQQIDNWKVDFLNKQLTETDDEYKERLSKTPKHSFTHTNKGTISVKQTWLKNLPAEYGFAEYLLGGAGAYGPTLTGRLIKAKVAAVSRTALAFSTASPEMTEPARQFVINGNPAEYAAQTKITDELVQRAINRVYRKPWADLDLWAMPGYVGEDVEVALARALISAMCTGSRACSGWPLMSPECALGIALVTGVPLGSWLQFALDEYRRRGETYISAQTVDSIIDMLECSELSIYLTAELRKELEQFRWEFQQQELVSSPAFAEVLRKGKTLLWSTGKKAAHSYHSLGLDEDGEPLLAFKLDKKLLQDL